MSMFPLGSVLFPHMPLRLRVFEERYLVMLSELVKAEDTRFGVVLIERGFEVGGGEHRFGVGTTADVAQIGAEDGVVGLVAQGTERFEVETWLADDPYPRAEVRVLPELVWDERLEPLRAETEQLVRRTPRPGQRVRRERLAGRRRAGRRAGAGALAAGRHRPGDRAGPGEAAARRVGRGACSLSLVELTRDAAVAWETPWPD